MSRSTIPVRRCAKCDRDWPNVEAYNLCPRCERCTFASTSERRPDLVQAVLDRQRYETIRAFDAKADAAAEEARLKWAGEMNALLAKTLGASSPTNYGLAGKPANAQDVRYPHRDA